MKKIVLIFVLVLALIGGIVAWVIFGPATGFSAKTKYLYIPSNNATKQKILELVESDSIVQYNKPFSWLASQMNYWSRIKPGKYRIASGNSIFNIVRLLRNGKQSPVNLVITKLRTKEDLAALTGSRFECDSLDMISYLTNNDTLRKYQLDSNMVMTVVFPNTYTYYWNTTPGKIFNKLLKEYNDFWTEDRKRLARAKSLTPQTAYILASIVEEETNKSEDKGNIASVYMNRIRKSMPLGADPTVKFALRDFSLKRIYHKHLVVESPYNTYRVTGLPPGPICTPSEKTIDAVLQAPETNYLYFVAKSDFSGHSVFAATYPEHLKYARAYQEALNKYMLQKQAAQDNPEK